MKGLFEEVELLKIYRPFIPSLALTLALMRIFNPTERHLQTMVPKEFHHLIFTQINHSLNSTTTTTLPMTALHIIDGKFAKLAVELAVGIYAVKATDLEPFPQTESIENGAVCTFSKHGRHAAQFVD